MSFFISTNAHLHRFTESSIHPPPIYIFLFIYKTIFLILHPSIHPYYIHFLIWWSIYPWLCEGGPTGVAPVLWREGARAHHLRHAEHRHGGQNQSVLPFGSVCLRTGARICFHQLLDVFAYLKPTTCSLILPVPTFLTSSFSLWSVTAFGGFRNFFTFIAFSYMLPLTEILVPLCHIYVHNCTHCTMHYCVANRLISLRICELIMLIVGLHCLPA